MSAQIIPFSMDALPAHIFNQFEMSDDLSRGVSAGGFPSISIKGKEFAIVRDGNRVPVTKRNEEGEEEVARYIDVVIVRANPNVSKVFYEGSFTEGSDAKPSCYSNDGHAPAADAEDPQCKSCSVCPHNQWGSRITENGGKAKACADSRRLALSAIGTIKDPMLLRVPAASLKELAEYNKLLQMKGVPYPSVVTRIGFQKGVAYPALVFKPIGFLDAVSAQEVVDVRDTDLVQQIVGTQAAPARSAPVEVDQTPAIKVAPKPIVKPKIKAAPVVEVEEDEDAPAPAPVAAKPKAKPVITVESDDGESSKKDDKLASAFQTLLSGGDFDDED